ncbi:DUF3043 domain-containing protein [Nocardioides insulae]|uniref:DUF3043 domain-containing protein n=1 Tax=Nocardioides insulae TaxID=394734 RepID=UPI0003FCFCA4|nr:DUF3043 domain-containing protein [Nocardioides insulae]
MFRRKSETAPVSVEQPAKSDGKGRPTPTRKEAEAAARARAKTPRTRKEQNAANRVQRQSQSAKMREAMKTGDDRYLPPRDKGPVKRFVRDFIDSRITVAELVLPLLVVVMLLGWSQQPTLVYFANTFMMVLLLVVAFNLVFLRWRLKKELDRRFPDESHRGTTSYAMMRALNMRFLRMPKTRVKIGEDLPEKYR